MSVYTRISLSDQKSILAHYGVEVLASKEISGGNANSNFRIQGENGAYMLTLFEEKSWQEVEALAKILQWFQQHGFPTTQVIPSQNQALVTEFGGKPVLVKSWIDGEVIEDLPDDLLAQIGASMARLHQVPLPAGLPQGHPYGLPIFPDAFDKGIDLEYESWLATETSRLKQNLPASLPSGLIHGDLFYDNVLFANGHLKAIIDFEEVCHYSLAFDLGMGILGLCLTENEYDLGKIQSLVRGYESIRPLEAMEKQALPHFIRYAAMATSFWRYWRYNVHSPNAERKHLHREMADFAKQVDDLPADILA